MAGIAVSGQLHHHRHTGSISQMETSGLLSAAPRIEMMRNPDFSFPALPAPRSPSLQSPTLDTIRRPVSVHSNASPNLSAPLTHRRHASALPSFNFNATDTAGLTDASTPPLTSDEAATETPVAKRKGHKRGGSEFVGGDSRLGVEGAISSSPTKSNAIPLPVPAPTRRGHAHRRSGALSSHDVRTIMHPTVEEGSRTSISLPPTPLDHPSQHPPLERAASSPDVAADPVDPFGPLLDSEHPRPVSRPRVGFSDNIEFIPRPLSTISSETESSISTVRGHSVNNSISSVLSLSTPSPPSFRTPRTSLSTTFEDDKPRARSSLEVSKRIEKEGEWLKSRSSQSLRRPLSEPAAGASISFALPSEPVAKPRNIHYKKHSLSHALGLDRRRSEPAISLKSTEASRSSAVSLQAELERCDDVAQVPRPQLLERRSSTKTKKLRDWAFTKIAKKPKEGRSTSSETVPSVGRPASAGEASVPGRVPVTEPSAVETDLDAVFSSGTETVEHQPIRTSPRQRFESGAAIPSYLATTPLDEDADGASAMVDLDAALGPLKTPSFSSHKQRRELHSSRGTKDFVGPGLHYHPGSHRRAESAPELAPFVRSSTAPQSLPDVFEGEGEGDEEVEVPRPASTSSAGDESASVGIHVVEAADPGVQSSWSDNEGLRIASGGWESERPTIFHGSSSSRLSTPSNERCPSSIIEQTILEESSPVEPVEIVEAHEEPRASSLTKSSDSSETPTLLASQTGTLALPDGSQSLMTPDTYQTSTFSSPDFSRRQSSFETSRVGTAASSITDNRTMSSCTGDQNVRMSVDDVPSLTSSRSTMMSTMHANTSHRDFGTEQAPPPVPVMDPVFAAERRRKRASIQSLSQLVGGSFSGKSKSTNALRPQTAIHPVTPKAPKRKEHRLKKLMFWRSKSKQSLHSDT